MIRRHIVPVCSALLALAIASPAWAGNPWQQLPAEYRKDLQGPLQNLRHYPWVQAAYNAWYEKWYTAGGQPKPGAPSKEMAFAGYYFDEVLKKDERESFLLLYAKVRKEGLWSIVKTVKWAGTGVAMLFEPSMPVDQLRKFLGERGFGDWWSASKDSPWGVRSRFGGPQLHFRGGEFINVHIDLHNPGDPASGKVTSGISELGQALKHFVEDLVQRNKTHTNPAVRAALQQQGLQVPEVE